MWLLASFLALPYKVIIFSARVVSEHLQHVYEMTLELQLSWVKTTRMKFCSVTLRETGEHQVHKQVFSHIYWGGIKDW